MKFEDIIDVLPKLTAQQRGQIAVRCTMLGTEVVIQKSCEPAELLWRGFIRVTEERDIILSSVAMAQNAASWPAFKRTCRRLDDWVKGCMAPESETERVKAYRIIADCIVRMIESWDNVPVLPSTLFKQAENATQAVEAQFPGYAAAGLLRRYVLLDAL